MSKVTIQDIAKAANVSKSTVSRVLNGTAIVADEKKRAVLEATTRLGFQPNVVARSLARGKSMTIGVLTQLIGSPFYDTIAQGVIAGLNGTGYSPIFVDGQWQRTEGVDGIRALIGRRVDGLVLVGGDVPGESISELCGGLPTVVVARRLPEHHCVFMDNEDGGYQATQHLIEHGHKNIALIQGLAHHPDAIDRCSGYRQALTEAGLPVNEALIKDGDFSAESGIRGIENLLAEQVDFTAVFAANDMAAFGARLALYKANVRVPEDVSLIGFDDQMEAAFATPPLSTIRQPAREMGQMASEAILQIINKEQPKTGPMQGTLIQRESVAPCTTAS